MQLIATYCVRLNIFHLFLEKNEEEYLGNLFEIESP